MLIFAIVGLSACATVPVRPGGSLASYEGLPSNNGRQSTAELRVDEARILAASTIRITLTRFAEGVGADLLEKERSLVANRVDRALCRELAKRVDVVGPGAAADLYVHTTVTHLGKTNKIAAGASVVASFVSVVPLISPRVLLGLGSLGIEAEALGPLGEQEAAMLWTRKAQPIGLMSNATVSRVSNAYQLSSSFGESFSRMLVSGSSPFGSKPKIKLPTMRQKKDLDCDVLGKDSGLLGMVANNFGAPPSWTDKGAHKANAGEADQQVRAGRDN